MVGRCMTSMAAVTLFSGSGWFCFGGGLLRVELDDQLLAHGDVDVLALWERAHRDLLAAVAGLEPADDRTVEHIDVVLDHDHLGRLRAERDDVALAHSVAGDVDALAVDVDETVVDELTGLRASRRPSGAVR